MLGVVWFATRLAAASSPSDAPTVDPCDAAGLAAAVADADAALHALDGPWFGVALDAVRARVACLDAPIQPPLAAAVHRLIAVDAVGRHDPLAELAFAAARRIDPAHPPDPALFPPGSPVDTAWQAVDPASIRVELIADPGPGWLALDGTRASARPIGLPTLAQRIGPDGAVVASAYVLPGAPLPAVPAPPPVEAPPPAPITDRRRHPARIALATATASAGAAAATTLGLAAHGRARYLDLDRPVPDAELDGLRARTNALGGAWVASATVCAASALALAVTW